MELKFAAGVQQKLFKFMEKAFGDATLGQVQIYDWFNWLEMAECSGSFSTTTMRKNVEKVQEDIIMVCW